MVNSSYKSPSGTNKWEDNKKIQSNMVIYLEKRDKDLEQEEQEFRKMVLKQKSAPVKNNE